MAFSSVTASLMTTSLAMGGSKYFVNQSTINWSGMGALINLHLHLHSCIWSDIWVELVWRSEINKSLLVSYQIGNWKWVKKAIAKVSKSQKECQGSSIYHFVATPMRVLWNKRRWIEPSIIELHYHKWNVITWFLESSLGLTSNLGISEGNLTGMVGQEGSCWIGSLINLDKSGISKVAKNGNCWLGWGYW